MLKVRLSFCSFLVFLTLSPFAYAQEIQTQYNHPDKLLLDAFFVVGQTTEAQLSQADLSCPYKSMKVIFRGCQLRGPRFWSQEKNEWQWKSPGGVLKKSKVTLDAKTGVYKFSCFFSGAKEKDEMFIAIICK